MRFDGRPSHHAVQHEGRGRVRSVRGLGTVPHKRWARASRGSVRKYVAAVLRGGVALPARSIRSARRHAVRPRSVDQLHQRRGGGCDDVHPPRPVVCLACAARREGVRGDASSTSRRACCDRDAPTAALRWRVAAPPRVHRRASGASVMHLRPQTRAIGEDPGRRTTCAACAPRRANRLENRRRVAAHRVGRRPRASGCSSVHRREIVMDTAQRPDDRRRPCGVIGTDVPRVDAGVPGRIRTNRGGARDHPPGPSRVGQAHHAAADISRHRRAVSEGVAPRARPPGAQTARGFGMRSTSSSSAPRCRGSRRTATSRRAMSSHRRAAKQPRDRRIAKA